MYLLVIGLVLFVWACQRYASTKYMRDAVRNIPGPFSIPLLGSVFMIREMNPKTVFTKAPELYLKYGTIMKAWAMNRLFVASGDAELNEQILSSTTHISKLGLYALLHEWLGVGLLMSDGKKWHSRRKIITPTFHFKILEEFLEVFDRQSTVLVDCLSEKADGQKTFDVYPLMSLYTLDVITETAMGTKVHAQTNTNMEYTAAVSEMTELASWRFLRVHLNNTLVYSLMYPHKKLRQMKLIRIMRNFTQKVIEERRNTLIENNMKQQSNAQNDHDDIGTKKRSALLDVLLQATIDGKPLSDEDIREEVETFMFEGHDTTATALSFTLHLLARDARVQQKLLAEIHHVYGADGSVPFTLMNLNELKYMDCVIRESLRMYPAVPIVGREIKTDFKYSHSRLGEGIIPAGTEFILSIHGTMNDPARMKDTDPREFRPERYEKLDANTVFNGIPFSAGPRNCIGQKFAMYEMKVSLTKIMQNYELLPLGEDVSPIVNIVLRSETGMQLGMKKRSAM